MRWGRADAPKVTLVGKGVCFDTGGLDIKPASGMLLMKKDMGGAANVLGLAHMIMACGLDLHLRVRQISTIATRVRSELAARLRMCAATRTSTSRSAPRRSLSLAFIAVFICSVMLS